MKKQIAIFFTIFSLFFGPFVHAEKNTKAVEKRQAHTTEGDAWAIGSSSRSEAIYPTNWGQAGLFRIRSAESLPEHALTFGIGAEFYAVSNAPDLGVGNTTAKTIAESIFVGFAPTKHLTLGLQRRSSSTTFGNPQQLISSLGDIHFSALYSFPLSSILAIAPIANFLVASNFNNLAPSGSTLSVGLGAALTMSLFDAVGVPLLFHANALYHIPQIRTNGPPAVSAESYFNFSRYHTISLGVGAELRLGDFIPFTEVQQTIETNGQLSYFDNPSKVTLGTRFMPFSNKSICFLLGADVGLGKGLRAGIPFSPGYQVIGQVSYTVGASQSERKHYQTTQDVSVVNRKFVIGKTIRFKTNSAILETDSEDVLNQIAEVIQQNAIEKLLIVGHTDSTATEEYNLKLSRDRAKTVRSYLISRGVEKDTLIAQGYGKRKPIASNVTESGRAQNRRVEFYILE